jgi:hypothetical protein
MGVQHRGTASSQWWKMLHLGNDKQGIHMILKYPPYLCKTKLLTTDVQR